MEASVNPPFLMKAWELDPTAHQYDDSVTQLIHAERQAPVQLGADRSLRAKVIDACGMTCTFCHNEGTPVAADERSTGVRMNASSLSGRVSVFAVTNGVNFIPGSMLADESFRGSLRSLHSRLDLNELHLTGGEPTLNKHLPDIVRVATQEGYSVKMTSNGENGARIIPSLASAGLVKVNFSIFGTTPEELASVQHEKFRDTARAARKIQALHRSIASAVENGVGVSANVVVPNDSHFERLDRILAEFEPRLELRLLPDLEAGSDSYFAIYKYLSDRQAIPTMSTIEAGSSNARVHYELPEGRTVTFKQIRPARLPDTCSTCQFNNNEDCKEGYYGIRLYVDDGGTYRVGVCIQRMDITATIEEFLVSSLADEVKLYKEQEYNNLIDVNKRSSDDEKY